MHDKSLFCFSFANVSLEIEIWANASILIEIELVTEICRAVWLCYGGLAIWLVLWSFSFERFPIDFLNRGERYRTRPLFAIKTSFHVGRGWRSLCDTAVLSSLDLVWTFQPNNLRISKNKRLSNGIKLLTKFLT